MAKEEIIDMEEAERIAIAQAKKRIKEGEIKDVDIESTELQEMGEGTPVFIVSGFATYIIEKGGVIKKERTGKKYFKAQIHAMNRKILGFTEHE